VTATRKKRQVAHLVHFETKLSQSVCRKCRRPLLIGPVKGELRRIDRTRLSVLGEYAALLDGCRTYETGLTETNLFPRRPFHINQGLPRHGRVLADHHCGWVWAVEHYDLRDLYPQANDDGSGECPF
jgi:hypothetical protein